MEENTEKRIDLTTVTKEHTEAHFVICLDVNTSFSHYKKKGLKNICRQALKKLRYVGLPFLEKDKFSAHKKYIVSFQTSEEAESYINQTAGKEGQLWLHVVAKNPREEVSIQSRNSSVIHYFSQSTLIIDEKDPDYGQMVPRVLPGRFFNLLNTRQDKRLIRQVIKESLVTAVFQENEILIGDNKRQTGVEEGLKEFKGFFYIVVPCEEEKSKSEWAHIVKDILAFKRIKKSRVRCSPYLNVLGQKFEFYDTHGIKNYCKTFNSANPVAVIRIPFSKTMYEPKTLALGQGPIKIFTAEPQGLKFFSQCNISNETKNFILARIKNKNNYINFPRKENVSGPLLEGYLINDPVWRDKILKLIHKQEGEFRNKTSQKAKRILQLKMDFLKALLKEEYTPNNPKTRKKIIEEKLKLEAQHRSPDHQKIKKALIFGGFFSRTRKLSHKLKSDAKYFQDNRLIKQPVDNMLEDGMKAWLTLFEENIKDFKKEDFLTPVPHAHSQTHRYVTREANLDARIDFQIFTETQIKRFLRMMINSPLPILSAFFNWFLVSQLKIKLDYFSEQEDKEPKNKIYVERKTEKINLDDFLAGGKDFRLMHVGHATEQFSVGDQIVLTDPVFYGLAPVFYPSMTHGVEDCDTLPDKLPDVIVISHNHRDHVDGKSLCALVQKALAEKKKIPTVFVPRGDASFFKLLGFTDVKEFAWHEKATIPCKKSAVTYIAVPADHRSGRQGAGGSCPDSHASLVTGWVISHKKKREITYFAGDTARLNDTRNLAVATHIYTLYEEKIADELLPEKDLPKIINTQPAGPNYTRKEMEPTHQSVIDSFISPFRLAVSLAKISKLKSPHLLISPAQWLGAIVTVIMHSGKFELGPDRFNEGRFLFIQFIKCLLMNENELSAYETRQKKKSESWSLFHHRKDFVCDGVRELKALAEIIWPDKSEKEATFYLVDHLLTHIRFPLVNESFDTEKLFDGKQETSVKNTQKWENPKNLNFITDRLNELKPESAAEIPLLN